MRIRHDLPLIDPLAELKEQETKSIGVLTPVFI